MRVGITGPAEGASPAQERELRTLLLSIWFTEFHHGDCIGVDALGHEIARGASSGLRRPRIIIHPPDDDKKRAFCAGDEIRQPRPYLDRDEDIAREVDVLIALPSGPEASQPRSGTWATVRRGRKHRCLVIRIELDGTIQLG